MRNYFVESSQIEQEMYTCLVTRTKFGGSSQQYREFLELRKAQVNKAIKKLQRKIRKIELAPDLSSEMLPELDKAEEELETAVDVRYDIEWAEKKHW